LSHANQLFSRDLKHFVDPGYAVQPLPNRRKVLTVLAGVGAVAAVIWIGSLVLSLFGGSPDISDASGPLAKSRTGVPVSNLIASQNPGSGKPLSQSAAQAVQSRGSKNSNNPGAADTAEDSDNDIALPDQLEQTIRWSNYEIKRGDSLSRIFKKQKLSTVDALRIAAHKGAGDIRILVPGRMVRIGRDEDSKLRALSFELRNNKSLNIVLETDGSIRFDSIQDELDKHPKSVDVEIESSLFKAAADAGLSDKLILKLAGIFGWEIDFAKDLQKGDRFSIIHEELMDGSIRKGEGNILAARYVSQDRELYAFRHVLKSGRVEYFDAEGGNLRGTFLRTPMKISRVTSGFSKSRRHPISKEWKEHQGVDYAAPRGTPVLATANGSIGFIGTKNGYGKTVVLKHANGYGTLYGHLSSHKSKIKPGTPVKQGQIIGFVGQTGSATAPHLHYEFRVNGEHVDPLGYELPRAEPIADNQREVFLRKARELKAAMVSDSTIQLARNDAG